MTEVIVTRGGQVTLTKDVREKLSIREGDIVMVNVLGNIASVSKKDPAVFEKHNFLPDNFPKLLAQIRRFSLADRLKRLGITG